MFGHLLGKWEFKLRGVLIIKEGNGTDGERGLQRIGHVSPSPSVFGYDCCMMNDTRVARWARLFVEPEPLYDERETVEGEVLMDFPEGPSTVARTSQPERPWYHYLAFGLALSVVAPFLPYSALRWVAVTLAIVNFIVSGTMLGKR